MSTLATVLTFSRTQAQTDSNGITDTNGIVWANEALLDFHRQMIAGGVDASQLQESYASFTAGTGTYLYPTDMFFLKAIELNYVNTNTQDYVMAQQVDVSNIPGQQSFSWLRSNADRQAPQFDDRGDWFEVFPTPQASDNATNSIKIFYFLEPTQFAATSDIISYPESLDYTILGWKIAASYLYSLGDSKVQMAQAFDKKYQDKVTQLLSTLKRGSQQPLQATPIQLTGFEF